MPETGKFPMLSLIQLQSSWLVVPFRQFLLVSDLRQYSPWNSNTLISAKFCISTNQQQTIPIRQSLHFKLKWYLIVFDLQTIALYQRKHTRLLLSHRNDNLKSSNFTSRPTIPKSSSNPLERYITHRRPYWML